MIDLKRLKELDAAASWAPWEHTEGVVWAVLPHQIGPDDWEAEQVRIADTDANNAAFIAASRTELPKLVAWASAIVENLTGILCERDDGAPTPRNLELAKLLAEIE